MSDIQNIIILEGKHAMNILERKNTDLIKEFNRYVREHPEFTDKIPNAEKRQPIVCIRIKKIQPIRSRIEEIEVEQQTTY